MKGVILALLVVAACEQDVNGQNSTENSKHIYRPTLKNRIIVVYVDYSVAESDSLGYS